ncbi:MAG TPA: DUF4214 domain-containing protein [Pyrinomonadaceae bacterium]|jgi:hypothetical protein
MSRRPFLRELLIFLAFFALTALMTWPWILHLRDAVSDRGDPYSIVYWLWWDYHQTFHDPLNLFQATVFYPYKYTMAFTENDYGVSLLFFPLFALGFRPLTIHSIATLVAFAFSGYGMFRLARTLTGSQGAAWIAGIIFAFLPYHFQRLPHLHLIFAGWIPLLLEALVLFARERRWRRAGWLGVAFTMNALTSITWFILTLLPLGLSAIFLLLWYRPGRDRAFWLRGGLALGAAALVLLFFMLPYYRVHQLYGFARSAEEAGGLSARPIHWLAASERNMLWKGLGGKAAVDELMLFPGLLPPLLALASFFLIAPAARRFRGLKLQQAGVFRKLRLSLPSKTLLFALDVLALALLLLALLTIGYGSIHLRLFGFELLSNSSPTRPLIFFLATLCLRWWLAYPELVQRIMDKEGLKNLVATLRTSPRSAAYALGVIWGLTGFLGSFGMNLFFHRLLFDLVPFFKSMRAPSRWAMICYVGLSMLAGLGAVQVFKLLGRWRPRLPGRPIYVALAVLILFEQRVAPVQFARGEVDPDALTLRLKETPMSGGIVELPAERDNYSYFRYMLRAADHGRPIVTASASYAPPVVREIEELTRMRPIPNSFIELLEQIPASYLVVHNSSLSLEARHAIESFLARGMAAGRIRFVNSYGDSPNRDDLYAITRTEPGAQAETAPPAPIMPVETAPQMPGSTLPASGSQSFANSIDDTRFFVRQQYLDLLNREPGHSERDKVEASLNSCRGEAGCLLERRILSALDIFHSGEFQATTYFVYRLYKTAFGRLPKYTEWADDLIRLRADSAGNSLAFAQGWARRAEFLERYPAGLTAAQYVAKLLQTSGQRLTPAKQRELVEGLDNGQVTRADVLVAVADNPSMAEREYNEAFVAICYLNYLKRDPDEGGYDYWLRTLRDNPTGEAAAIRGFIYAGEYRARFGPP